MTIIGNILSKPAMKSNQGKRVLGITLTDKILGSIMEKGVLNTEKKQKL